jgi:hypothetical protein
VLFTKAVKRISLIKLGSKETKWGQTGGSGDVWEFGGEWGKIMLLDTIVWVEWSKSMCEDGDIIEKPFEIVNSIKITAGCSRGGNMEQLTLWKFSFLFAHILKL